MDGFVKISRYAGMREDLVQAGGGNSSFKISEHRMLIKASGYQLADVTQIDGYAVVDPEIIKERFLACKNLDALTEEESKQILRDAFIEGKRPSIETFLHAISGRYTLHTHSMVVNALACRKGGMDILQELFPEALLVPYATPGVELAKSYFKAYKAAAGGSVFQTVFLQNHGLVVCGESADAVIEKSEEVTKKIEKYLKIDLAAYHDLTKVWALFPDKVLWKVTDENVLETYRRLGEWRYTFCPDCVVFLGKKMLNLPETFDEKDVGVFSRQYGEPVLIRYGKALFILADNVRKAMEIQSVLSFSAQVMALNEGCECNLLSDNEQNHLLNWDAEKYRKSIK